MQPSFLCNATVGKGHGDFPVCLVFTVAVLVLKCHHFAYEIFAFEQTQFMVASFKDTKKCPSK